MQNSRKELLPEFGVLGIIATPHTQPHGAKTPKPSEPEASPDLSLGARSY